MPRTIESRPLSRTTINLYSDTLDRLKTFYPDIPPSQALRHVVERHLEKLERQVEKADVKGIDLDV